MNKIIAALCTLEVWTTVMMIILITVMWMVIIDVLAVSTFGLPYYWVFEL